VFENGDIISIFRKNSSLDPLDTLKIVSDSLKMSGLMIGGSATLLRLEDNKNNKRTLTILAGIQKSLQSLQKDITKHSLAGHPGSHDFSSDFTVKT
jgi:hypothetical protein